MVRLLGVDLPRNKRIEYALTYIHGIGLTTAKQIVANAEIDTIRRTDDLSIDETVALRTNLEALDLKLKKIYVVQLNKIFYVFPKLIVLREDVIEQVYL